MLQAIWTAMAIAAAPLAPPVALDEAAVAALEQAAAQPDAIGLDTDRTSRLTTGVAIAGRGPFPFLVDTGATRSIVSDRLADALALPAGPTLRMLDIAGTTSVRSVRLDSYQVGARRFGPTLSPVVGQADLGAAGLIGVDALAGQQVLIDVEHGRMSVIAPSRARFDPDTIVVTARSRLGQLVMTDATLNGRRVSVVIDTGAQVSIGNPALLRALGRRKEAAATTLTGVSGGTAPASIALLPELRIGGLTLGGLPVAFADAEVFRRFGLADRPAMLLGMDVVRAFRAVAIDFGSRKVRFLMQRGGRAGTAQAALSMPSSPSLR